MIRRPWTAPVVIPLIVVYLLAKTARTLPNAVLELTDCALSGIHGQGWRCPSWRRIWGW
ncbi:MAG TPA: hypothetical protein VGG25_10240 [Streptosporangiaceae bacterium]